MASRSKNQHAKSQERGIHIIPFRTASVEDLARGYGKLNRQPNLKKLEKAVGKPRAVLLSVEITPELCQRATRTFRRLAQVKVFTGE